jgi:hypothetical protein
MSASDGIQLNMGLIVGTLTFCQFVVIEKNAQKEVEYL